MVEDYLTWPGRVKPFADSPFRRVLGVPLKVKNQVIGVINVTDDQKTGPFSDGDVELLGLFADQAAIAVENARLFAEVQRLSNTDELTGLYNRRQFFELAGCEFERACRYRHPLSAIMIDTDHFKQVNDTYGHAVGDQVLKDMGTRFRENLRKIDIIGRYGGDEFSILLPEDDLDSAHHAAERLRRCIADSPVDTNQGPLAVTVSVGVAAFSQDCLSLKSLLDRADIAMYVAKENGNNRVEIYRSD
jgi:diguanylate cyclase (GGDEF)-like protein